MTSVVQLSILDHTDLIGGARHGVELTAADIADDFGLITERSFDDIGYFHVLCLEYKGVRMAFQHRFQRANAGTMVTFGDLGAENPIRLIAEICDIGMEEVHVFEPRPKRKLAG